MRNLKAFNRTVVICLFFCVMADALIGQRPVEVFTPSDFNRAAYEHYGHFKKIPEQIKPQVLTALSYYPELRPIKIKFRIKRRRIPLTSRPRILSIFRKKKNRNYLITISSKSSLGLSPILLSNLPYNAQIGVLGHELAHISHYNTKNTFQLLGIAFGMLNSRQVDRFEWNTDRLTIAHGLGYQLLDWSVYVRKALRIEGWHGASNKNAIELEPSENERYMNPETILSFIGKDGQYVKD